jgi:hypothetical protein
MPEPSKYTVASAREAADRDELADWVARFLASPGSDNAELGEMLAGQDRWWLGPVLVPLDRLHRLAGPPDAPVLCAVNEDYWGDNVDEMEHKVEEGWEPPPVVVTYREGQLVLEDGNHRVESIRRTGTRETWAVIAFDHREDRDNFEVLRSA